LRAEENALENDKTQHALTRALQLYSHANYLAGQQLDAAAEWRYRVAASIAAKYAQPRMAAHSLATLGGLLVLRNRHHEALATADDALSHAHDTVALYLQGSMRLKLGNLHTDAEVRMVAQQLQNVAGNLPSEHMEAERASQLAELSLYYQAESDVWACFEVNDAAKVLICLFGRLAFG